MIINRRKRRTMPQLNTTSTADISFMLLILFLVTTSMDADKGLARQLPPIADPATQVQANDVSRRNVMQIKLTANSQILINGRAVDVNKLQQRVEEFVDNPANRPDLPEKTVENVPLLGRCRVADKHVLSLDADRNARYDTYIKVQTLVMNAYTDLRNKLARKHFGLPYSQCNDKQKDAIRACYPFKMTETYNTQEGGAQ